VNSWPPETRARKFTAEGEVRRSWEEMEERVGGGQSSAAKEESIAQVPPSSGWTLATHRTPMPDPPFDLRKSKRPSAAKGESASGPQESAVMWRR
jgi:hypothetical protein